MTRSIVSACAALALAGVTASAQSPRPAQSSQPSMEGRTVTVTGCLSVWDETLGMARSDVASPQAVSPGARQYVLANVQGGDATYVLETPGGSANLRGHVNHTIEVTGVARDDNQRSDRQAAAPAGGTELPSLSTLTVTSVKMVSAGCR